MVDPLLAPQVAEHLAVLAQAGQALLVAHPEGVELLPPVACADILRPPVGNA